MLQMRQMDAVSLVIAFLIAMLASLLGAMLGIGGGSIFVPLMDMAVSFGAIDISFQEIIATSLVCVIATSNVSSVVYIRRKITNIRLAIFLGITNVMGAAAGAILRAHFPDNILRMIFGVFLVFASVNMLRKRDLRERVYNATDILALKLKLNASYYDEAERKEVRYTLNNTLRGLLLGFIGGFLAGLLGIGGGTVNVPIMVLILGTPQKVAAATSLLIIGMNGATGGLIDLTLGHINPYIVSAAIFGILIGAYIGTRFLRKLRNEALRKIFAMFLLYVAIRMILKGLGVI